MLNVGCDGLLKGSDRVERKNYWTHKISVKILPLVLKVFFSCFGHFNYIAFGGANETFPQMQEQAEDIKWCFFYKNVKKAMILQI